VNHISNDECERALFRSHTGAGLTDKSVRKPNELVDMPGTAEPGYIHQRRQGTRKYPAMRE
jgi:hypothetical protein